MEIHSNSSNNAPHGLFDGLFSNFLPGLNIYSNNYNEEEEDENDQNFSEEEATDSSYVTERTNTTDTNSESEDDSDVVCLDSKKPSDSTSDSDVQFSPNESKNKNNIKPKVIDETMVESLRNDIYNPNILRSILSRLDGVNPNDALFNEFYNENAPIEDHNLK